MKWRVALGFVLGILALGLARFAFTPWPEPPHYHANWMVVIDGRPLDLSGSRYMEDVAACAAAGQVIPAERVHMHNGEDEVVHVHHSGVAWGHFFENLGFGAGAGYLILDDGRRFFEEDGRTLKYVVNGFVVEDVHTRLVRPGDRLLVSYGPESAETVLETQFPQVPADAPEYDARNDPATCAGARDVGVLERLRRAFWG